MERGEYDASDFRSVLKYMRQRFGRELFRNPKRMSAVLRDLAPSLDAENNVLRQLGERGLLSELDRAQSRDVQRVMMKLRACLTDYLQLPPERADDYLSVLMDVYGVSGPPPRPSTIPQTSGRAGILAWSLDASGVLTVSGDGPMPDYPYDPQSEEVNSPWRTRRAEIVAVILSDGVTSVGDSAFYGCPNLRTVALPESLERVGEWSFAGCAKLDGVTLPANLRRIERGAFSDCKSLSEIVIPEGVAHIESWTFCNCTRLRRVTIPDSAASIGQRAFRGCPLLTCVQIPSDAWAEDSAFDDTATILRRTPYVETVELGDGSVPDGVPASDATDNPTDAPSFAPPDFAVPSWFNAENYRKFLLALLLATVIWRHGFLTLLLLLVPAGLLLFREQS